MQLGGFLLGLAVLLLFLLALFSVVQATKIVAYGCFLPIDGIAATLAVATMGITVRHGFLMPAGERGRLLALAVLGGLVAAAVPYAGVVAMRQEGSGYWYLIFLAFLPSGLAIGGQIDLIGLTLVRRQRDAFQVGLAVLALVGAVGLPVLASAFLRFEFPPGGAIAFPLPLIAIAADFALFGEASPAGGRR